MADKTAIEWTDATWNPVTGCDRVSPGCAHCYALDLASRLKRMGSARYQNDGDPKSSGPGFGVTLHPDVLEKPLRWRKPRRVFVNSMSDLFHEEVPDEFIADVFDVMAKAPQHTFQVLTKRPERMRDFLAGRNWRDLGGLHFKIVPGEERPSDGPLPNVWLGVSIENRRFVHRADLLRETPAAVRFISAEPLLGPLVNLPQAATRPGKSGPVPDPHHGPSGHRASGAGELDLTEIDWLICGGESGPSHRPIRIEWVRDLRDAAQDSDTAFFFKQWGGRRAKEGGRLLDGRTWDEMPAATEAGRLYRRLGGVECA